MSLYLQCKECRATFVRRSLATGLREGGHVKTQKLDACHQHEIGTHENFTLEELSVPQETSIADY